MEKAKKIAKKVLVLSIVLMLLSMIVASVVQTNGGKVKIKQLTIETPDGWMMDMDLYIPNNATAETPAPGIVTSHGHYNNKEMQDANYVELARRGFVVLNIDQPSHGNSDNLPGEDTASVFKGTYWGAKFLAELNYVDSERIGVTGHSAGASTAINSNALKYEQQYDTHYIAAALLNCGSTYYKDSDGNFSNSLYGNRDVGVVAAYYDEFFYIVYGEDGETPIAEAPTFMQQDGAQVFLSFGEEPDEVKQPNTIYTKEIDGKDTIRVIYQHNMIHPWSHFSATATASVIDFFDRTLDAPISIEPNKQVWQWKEAFNFVGCVGLALFIISFAVLMTYTPFFKAVGSDTLAEPIQITDSKGKKWFWIPLAISAVFSTVIYFPSVAHGYNIVHGVQPESMGIALWSVLCGLFCILSMWLAYKKYGKSNGFDLVERGVVLRGERLWKTIVLGVLVFAVSYTWVFFADFFFKTDFRLWTLAFKTFTVDKVGIAAWPFVWMFLLFYIPSSISVNAFNYNTIGKKGWVNCLIIALFVVIPCIVLPIMQYTYYVNTGFMLFFDKVNRYNMYCLWLFPMLAVLGGATFISRCIYKATKNPYLAGIVSALMVTFINVINTRTFVV